MNLWGDALQAVIKHDHNQRNMEGYLVVRHNETGVIHFFSDFDLKMSVKRDIKKGIYTLINSNARVHNNPNPLTMDQLIPFVTPNWLKSVNSFDNTKIPSPLVGYVPTLLDLVGERIFHLVAGDMSKRWEEFDKLGDYVTGFLRLKTNDIKDGIEYAYIYYGNTEHPDWEQGLHVYLSYLNDSSFKSKYGIVIDSQMDFVSGDGKLQVPAANRNLQIWPEHVLNGSYTPFTEMYGPFEPSNVNKPLYDGVKEALANLAEITGKLETYSYDTHEPFDLKQIIEPKYWKDDDSWKVVKKGMDYRPESFNDAEMNLLHKSLSGDNSPDINDDYLHILLQHDTVLTAGMASDHKATLPVAETIMQFLEQQDTNWVADIENFIPDSDYKTLAKDIVTIYANHLKRPDTVAMISNHILQAEASGIKVSDITKAVYHYVTEAEPVYPDENQDYPIG